MTSAFAQLLKSPQTRTGSAFQALLGKKEPIKPRGEQVAIQFQAPPGGSDAFRLGNGNVAFRTASGSTWEYTPEGKRIVHLAAQFGGGSYTVGETLKDVRTPRDYAGVPTLTKKERDHIIPVSLGGISTSKTNIRSVPADLNPAKFETEIARKVKSGEMTLGAGRQAVIDFKQQRFGKQPQSKIGKFFSAIGGAFSKANLKRTGQQILGIDQEQRG